MDRDALLAAGFKPVTYEGLSGECFTKRQRVDTLPYASESLVDGEYVTEGMMAVTEVLPDGRVQLLISDADYVEGPVSGEEAIALLKDAGVVFADPSPAPSRPKP